MPGFAHSSQVTLGFRHTKVQKWLSDTLGEAISSPYRCFFQIISLHNCFTLCWNVLFMVPCCWNSYSCSRQRRKESASFYNGFLGNLWNCLLFEYCSAVGLGCSLLLLPLADRLNSAMLPLWETEGELQAWPGSWPRCQGRSYMDHLEHHHRAGTKQQVDQAQSARALLESPDLLPWQVDLLSAWGKACGCCLPWFCDSVKCYSAKASHLKQKSRDESTIWSQTSQ